MDIGFYIIWDKNSLKSTGNVVGDELFAESLCKSINKQYKSINAELYAPNYIPKKKLDVLIYLNESAPIEKFSRYHFLYLQNGSEENKDKPLNNMTIEYDEAILEKSLVTEKILNTFLDQVLDNFQLDEKNLALVGFSQGCMMIIQIALKKKKQINCLVGYSGKIINKRHLSDNIVSRPKIFLMHGDRDTIVSPSHLLESKEFLVQQNLKIRTKIFKNCEHKKSVEGSSFGLEFLRKNLL